MCFRGRTCGPCEETREQDRGYKAGQNWRDCRSQTSRGHKLRRYGLTEEQLRAIGLLGDSTDLLLKAVEYLKGGK
jgi:hypothetical protein